TLHDPGANVAGVVTLGADVDAGDGSGVESVAYEVSPAGANDWTVTPPDWDTTALTDGLYDLRATATDRAGNATTPALVIGVRVDNHPPTVSISSPAAGSYVNAASPDPRPVTAAAADSGSGIDHVDFCACSDSSAGCATGTWNALGTATSAPWSADLPLPADGDRALRAVAVDRTGHTASDVVTVTVDRTPPETTLDGTPGDPSNEASPDVAFSSSEPGSTFECRLDGAAWQPCASPDTLAALADGQHSVDVRATDPAGNVDATPASWTWLVDTTPPTATMDDPGRVVRGTVSLSSTTADPGDSASGVASVVYEYSADGGATWAPAPAGWDTTSVEDGVYELRVVATDHAGNVTASSPVTDVRVDNTAPTTSLDDPAANVRGTITLTGAAA